ncbi:hypothetical protein [Paraburkholderia sp. SIMBA_027]|uniref:hypothetical protein n=1 Tax=Paraburkholderia sp. SIMBA_027 TaxID=3085770 RepID=UPI003979B5FB
MDDETGEEVAAIAGKLLQQVIELGLAWDEAVAAFGLVATAALAAANAGADLGGDCVSIARQQLMAAFEFDVRVIVATNLPDRAEAEAGDNPLLATALRRHGSKLH